MKPAHLLVLGLALLGATVGNLLLVANGSTSPAAALAVTLGVLGFGVLVSALIATIDSRGEWRQEVVQQIRAAAAEGVTVPDLAASTGLPESEVRRILESSLARH
ncbi:helix-turn-helix domain-containing protein [Gordonia rubripertincta]|uniref:helix-turn-helix domain-containing protein n=1 Tax=Gordonia rubripertincta TaxID=36822 RepID=UPI0015F85F9A|nr:helix-turn-helix domain-containing protein [Gordonia rubripertincta]QMU22481.1 helix-turn-helix domain-containing protein [Gordonia rubripertincta]